MGGQAKVDVKLPRLETLTDADLTKEMPALGMPNAFDIEKADFSELCNMPTYINLMKQVSKFKLDEEGTEVSSATVIGDILGSSGDETESGMRSVNSLPMVTRSRR